MKLLNKVAIVTGGGRGIGKAIALALAKSGCNVVVAARIEEEISESVREISNLGAKGLAIKTDVRFKEDIENLVEKAMENFHQIDILINNAGILIRKNLMDTTEEEWDNTMDTNLKGMYLCCKEVLPIMMEQNSGIIINISSGAGKYGCAEMSAYCASKFAVIGLTESLASELEERGIKVYTVCPSGVDTKLYREAFPEEDSSTLLKPDYVAGKILEVCLNSEKIKSGTNIDIG